MGILYVCAGRLTALFGGFRPGQYMSEAQHVQAVLDAGLVTEGPRHTPDQQQAHRILAQNFTSDQTGIQIRLDREQHPDQEHAAPLTPHLQHQDRAAALMKIN